MTRRVGACAVACATGALIALPAAAAAKTKTVYADAPPAAQKVLQKYSASANEFFLRQVTIHVGDKVKFIQAGFHTIDLPGKSKTDLPLLVSNGLVSGDNDAAGNPFWFNGKLPALGLNPQLIIGAKSATYNGSTRVVDPVPGGSGPPAPMVVKFTKAGKYKYFCDIHAGMVGYVVVKAKNAKIPTAKQDAQALKVQIKQAETSAKQDARIKPAKNSVALGSSDSSGVEDFAMFPATLTVKAGTTVTFAITKHSREVHTASFGPTSYLTAVSNSIQSPNTMQQAWYPSDDPSLGVPSVTPTSHGNGFVSTGVVDSDKTTTTIPSSGKLKFTTAGTYHFICLIHPFMHGTVVVTP